METWFGSVVPIAELLCRYGALPEPEFSLGGTARKDDMGELLDFLPDGRICCLPEARGSVSGGAGDGNQNVLGRPLALVNHLA